MGAVCTTEITGPSAWKAASKDALALDVTPQHLDRFDRLLKRVEGRPIYDIAAADFDDPMVAALMRRALFEIREGTGMALLRLPTDRYSEEQQSRLYWGLGSLMGLPLSQSVFGDRLGHVQQTDENPHDRGYRSDRELIMHNDSTDVTGLLCLQQAKSGGISQFASCVTIHNEILKARPDLLPVLYAGHPWHRSGEQAVGEPPITPFNVPVFAFIDGWLSCKYLRAFMEMAAAELSGALPPDLAEAMACFEAVAYRPDVMAEFFLEPGEMVFLNNYTILHARTQFTNGALPSEKRHLLRLWLGIPGLRPVPEAMHGYVGQGIKPRADFAKAETV